MLKTQTLPTSDGRVYTVSMLPAWQQYLLLGRIGAAIGPSLAHALGGAKSLSTLADLDLSVLGPAVDKLFLNLTRAEQKGITEELLANVLVDGKPLLPAFDFLMQGRMGELFKLLKFSFEVNFGNFSDAVGALVSQFPAALPSEG